MDWDKIDWSILDRLRDGFLSGTAASGPYWQSAKDLDHYDATFGERIGWKWDAVLGELKRRGWVPPAGTLLDWGCGSGIASRRVVAAFGVDRFPTIDLWDHSPQAREYARGRITTRWPETAARIWNPDTVPSTVVISHVLTEMNDPALKELLALVRKARAVIWIEPGTHAVGRRMGTIRDSLLDEFSVFAPCTHRRTCPQLDPGRERDWCHFFALPPSGIYADSQWVRFGQRAGIDLRSLPYSYLVLEKTPVLTSPPDLPEGAGRIIGRTDGNKVGTTWLECNAGGFDDVSLPKRVDSALVKKLEKKPGLPLVVTTKEEGRVIGVREVYP